MIKLILVVVSVSVFVEAATVSRSSQDKPPLQFSSSDRTFKIMQFADLHFGEGEGTSWGPFQDYNSLRVMRNTLWAEAEQSGGHAVDLVVFSGDQLTGNNIRSNATEYWSEVVSVVQEFGVKWCAVFGNHDDAPLQPASPSVEVGAGANAGSITTRQQLMAYDMSFDHSYSQMGATHIHGVSNYILPILAPSSAGNLTIPAAVLYFLDSGGGSYDEQVYPDQVEWFLNQSTTQYPATPALVFVHIPDPVYTTVTPTKQPPCFGMADDGITPTTQSNGLFDAFATAGTIRAVSVGHDHGNDFCCPYQPANSSSPISICYGRHTGYGGYGDWARGARVFELTLSTNSAADARAAEVSIKTWVRMEWGDIIDGGNL